MQHKPISTSETVQMRNLRIALGMLRERTITDGELRKLCPRDDQRANLVALLLAGGFAAATLYPINPGSEATHG